MHSKNAKLDMETAGAGRKVTPMSPESHSVARDKEAGRFTGTLQRKVVIAQKQLIFRIILNLGETASRAGLSSPRAPRTTSGNYPAYRSDAYLLALGES